MKKGLTIVTALVALVLFAFTAFSAEFAPLGNRALSMGGAGVAQSRGAVALYYNPALLAEPRHTVEISVGVGAGFREDNLADNIDSLATENSAQHDFVGALESIADSFVTNVTSGATTGDFETVVEPIVNGLTQDNLNDIFPDNPIVAQTLYNLTTGAGGPGLELEELLDEIESGVTVDTDALASLIVVTGNADPDDGQTVADGLEIISKMGREGNGVQLAPSAAIGAQVGKLGVGVFVQGEVAGTLVADPNRVNLIVKNDIDLSLGTKRVYVKYDPASDQYSLVNQNTYEAESLEYALDNELTYVHVSGLVTGEVPVGYAHKFQTGYGSLSLGGSLKYIRGIVYDQVFTVNTESNELDDDLKDNIESNFGIDIGLLYKPKNLANLSIGLVGKNLNAPKFTSVQDTEFTLDCMVRGGISYDTFGEKLSFALDVDLTENKTCMGNFKSQYIGGGVDFHPASWFSLRAGAMQNIKESHEGTIITGGFGFGLKWLQLDIAGALSTKQGKFDGNSIPRYARVQVALVSKWF